jgi:hypothetical protein
MNNINQAIMESYSRLNESTVLDEFIDYIDKYMDVHTFLEMLWQDLKIDTSMDELRDLSDKEFSELLDKVKSHAKESIGNVITTEDGMVDIYRAMNVDPKWGIAFTKGTANVGKYWSYDKDMAKSYDLEELGNGELSIILHAKVPVDSIDILETYMYSTYKQSELRVNTDEVTIVAIDLVSIGKNDKYDYDKIHDAFNAMSDKVSGKVYSM